MAVLVQRRGKKLGEVLLSQGLLTEEQLREASSLQRKSGKSMASILVSANIISSDDISMILGEQIQIASRKRIGEVLVDQGLITESDLMAGLEQQKSSGKRLGECLVELGHTTENKIIDILSAQLDVQHVLLEHIKVSQDIMDIVPQDLCKKYKVLPIYAQNGVVTIAMADPTDLRTIDHIKFMVNKEIDAVIASEKEIVSAIERIYSNKHQEMSALLDDANSDHAELEIVGDEEEGEELTDEEGMQVVKVVNLILHEAIEEEASDIHLEPTDKGLLLRLRIDGEMEARQELPLHMRPQIISRLKIQAGMDISEKRKPQDGRIKMRHNGRNVDLRVSSFPAVTRLSQSEKIVMRIIDAEGKAFTLPQLGLSKDTLDKFKELIKIPDGVILVTGPTGSGKSSTLYASLIFVNEHTDFKETIITMEDPVESSLDFVTQGQINPKAGFTFASGMRAILRQDPDIIMVGEMRDFETAQMAIQAALTGHLVFSTLHTNDSASAFTRLFDMGVAPYLVSSTVRGIMAQRLGRRLCGSCKDEYDPEPAVLDSLGLRPGVKLWRGVGCPKCGGSGYKGRLGFYELLIPDRQVEKLVIKKSESNEIKDYMINTGRFTTLRRDGLIKCINGETSLEQILGTTPSDSME
jgi:type IV pilus assembly protein PilB